MRHSNRNKKFGREKNQRRALMRTLAHSLFRDGRIETTEAKAKALRPFAERLITHAKSGTLASRRLIAARLGGTAALAKLYKEIAPRCAKRSGGYSRVVKAGMRRSDGAKMAVIELITDNK
ncbi:MAG: 50S ribosomal protein L17 [Patescibacteria group bacterium]